MLAPIFPSSPRFLPSRRDFHQTLLMYGTEHNCKLHFLHSGVLCGWGSLSPSVNDDGTDGVDDKGKEGQLIELLSNDSLPTLMTWRYSRDIIAIAPAPPPCQKQLLLSIKQIQEVTSHSGACTCSIGIPKACIKYMPHYSTLLRMIPGSRYDIYTRHWE